MKTIALTILGTLLVCLAVGFTPASPQGSVPVELRKGGTLFGFSVLRSTQPALDGLSPATPVSIRDVKENWILVDYPTQTSGPAWVNVDNVVSFRTNR
jgi:hypothetical protein